MSTFLHKLYFSSRKAKDKDKTKVVCEGADPGHSMGKERTVMSGPAKIISSRASPQKGVWRRNPCLPGNGSVQEHTTIPETWLDG